MKRLFMVVFVVVIFFSVKNADAVINYSSDAIISSTIQDASDETGGAIRAVAVAGTRLFGKHGFSFVANRGQALKAAAARVFRAVALFRAFLMTVDR